MVDCIADLDGDIHDAGRLRENIKELHGKIVEDEERLSLLKTLHEKGVCTRDIMAFIEQQGSKRLINKAWDFATASRAMNSKIRDAKKSLQVHRRQRASLKSQYFKLVNNKGHKVRKMMNSIRREHDIINNQR